MCKRAYIFEDLWIEDLWVYLFQGEGKPIDTRFEIYEIDTCLFWATNVNEFKLVARFRVILIFLNQAPE